MQTLYKFALEPIAEITADPNSYGFRAKRCVQDAIEQCFTCLNKAKSPKWVLEGDIKGCFDNISHEWILNHIPMDRDILRKWLKSGYVETGRLFPTDLGSPQGSAISPTICNMVLDGLEVQIRKKYHKIKRDGKAYFPKVNFIRYADDFIVTGESRELLEAGVLPIIREFLSERGLELSEEKTVITHIEDGFDFLGCNIRWYKDKLLTKPSKKNYKAIVNKIRGIIKQNPSMKQEDLIRKLNPVIRGWVNFQKYNVSSQAFDRGWIFMQIFVDADACPVVGIVEKIAKEHKVPVILLCDTNHVLSSDYSEVIVVGAGADAVDYKLINICHKGDIVVSQDYGVAAMALGKGAYAIHQSGNTNEDVMLMLDDMPSTTYYRNRKKAIKLYATMLWAFTRPERIQNKMEEMSWKKSGSKLVADRQ